MKAKVETLNKKLIWEACKSSIKMLNPREQIRNPVMFVTYVATLLTFLLLFLDSWNNKFSWFEFQISLWLAFTVLFANFAQSIAESRGKAQAASLRKTQIESYARVLKGNIEVKIPSLDLKKGDIFICETNDIIPADGEVVKGIATIDESAITGESAPVIRESGGDRSAVTTGTRVVSDRIEVCVTAEPGNSFLDRMISLIENAKRQKTPNEIALSIVLSALSIIFLLVVVSLKFFITYSEEAGGGHQNISVIILTALLVCLMPTTISALLSAVGIAGMDRLVRHNVIAKSGRAIEAAGDIDSLILDKTGTITLGNRMATAFLPVTGVTEKEFAEVAQVASLSDETPEGRSIVVLAKNRFDLRGSEVDPSRCVFIPFSAQSRMSGVDCKDETGHVKVVRKGAVDAVKNFVLKHGGTYPPEIEKSVELISKKGGTPLLVCENNKILGIIQLKDVVKGGIKRRFAKLRKMGIRTIMVTGDNPLTASAIAAEAGVDDFLAEATPEDKLKRIRREQEGGRLVAMAGDGTNDAPALAQADVGVAMNTGTQASREAGNFVDLDSNPTKLIEIVEIGKQLLMTRGSLTTFSIANDISKYFAIIPAIFASLYAESGERLGPLYKLNIMYLASPESAILSAVIFNAVVIIALIPLALKGVNYGAQTAQELLTKNLLIYGVGGLIIPFFGIKLIDLLINFLRLV